MKKDIYIKFILTIIALCLIWICIRGIRLGGNALYAAGQSFGAQDVRIVAVEIGTLKKNSLPVEVTNWHMLQPIPIK